MDYVLKNKEKNKKGIKIRKKKDIKEKHADREGKNKQKVKKN